MQNASPFKMKPLLVGLLTIFATTIAVTQAQAASNDTTRLDKQNAQTDAVKDVTSTGQANASQTDAAGITTTNDPAQPVNNSKYSDQYVKDYFTNTGVPPGTPLLAMPQRFKRSAGRFGEFRGRSKGDGYHAGIDMTLVNNNDDDLRAPGGGVVDNSYYALWMGNVIQVRRPNNDMYQFLHMKNNVAKKWPKGKEVTQGDMIGEVGGTGKPPGEGSYAKHLHFNYILPPSQKSRWRNLWLSKNSKNIGSSRFTLHSGKFTAPSGVGLKTDPTPYLAEDLNVKKDGYTPWLGSTIRQQFNVLYNTKLPVGPGATANLKPVPAMPVFNNGFEWTPDMLAAAKGSLIKGAEYSDWSGYQGAFGSNGMSYQALASFISSDDGEQFGSLPQPEDPISIDTMTPRQMVDAIASQRLGNAAWEKAMLKLSSKGLLTEYIMMTSAENYLEQQNQALRNRVELLIAGLTQARLFEFNKKIEAIQIQASAEAVPGIMDIELEDLGYVTGGAGAGSSVDPANLPDELNALVDALMNAIGDHEGDWDSYNTGTGDSRYPPICKMKGYFTNAQAANSGTPPITSMTPKQMYDSAYKVSNCETSRKFTAGKFQITYYTMAGEKGFGTGGFIAMYPEYANKPMTEEVQEFIARNYLILGPKNPALRDFIKYGRGTVRDAQLDAAKEWASIGTPRGECITKCRQESDGFLSYYAGKNNAASKSGTETVTAILNKIGQWHEANPGKAEGVLSGKTPDIAIGGGTPPPSP